MERAAIEVELRAERGSAAARRLRRARKVPGILYGPKRAPVPICLPSERLGKLVSKSEEVSLINVTSEAKEVDGTVVLIKEIQRHPATGEILHADLYEVDLKEKIRVTVPIRYVGKALGVTQGGILQPLKRTLEIECLPTEIPQHLEVDVTELGVHGVIHVADLELPGSIEVLAEETEALVTVLPPAVEEVKVAEAAEAPEAAAEQAQAAEAPEKPAEGAKKKEES
jgi:ribosomal protein L25, Ctc-form